MSAAGVDVDSAARPVPTHLPTAPGLLLLLATGSVDAYLYIVHGQVFAEAMTGNLVLVGVGTFSPDLVEWWRPLTAYAAFLVGIAIVWTLSRGPRIPPPTSQYTTLLLEIAVLVATAIVPESFPNLIVIAAVALTAGMQITAFNHIGAAKFTTVVMTSNSLHTMQAALTALVTRETDDEVAAGRLTAALTSFVAGVFIGAFASDVLEQQASFVPAGVFAAAGVWYLIGRRK